MEISSRIFSPAIKRLYVFETNDSDKFAAWAFSNYIGHSVIRLPMTIHVSKAVGNDPIAASANVAETDVPFPGHLAPRNIAEGGL